jgi:hypothetical protein
MFCLLFGLVGGQLLPQSLALFFYAVYLLVQANQSVELLDGVWHINVPMFGILRIVPIIALLMIAVVCAFRFNDKEQHCEAATTRDEES